MKNKLNWIIVHHTGGTDLDPLCDTSNQSFEVVNEYHRQKWEFKSSLGYYLGYQYYIDKNGKITQARSDTETGAHTIGQNDNSIGICLAGNFDVTLPNQKQVEALKTLVSSLMDKHNIPVKNVVPHRKFANKTCFGRLLADDWVQKLITVSHVNTTSCVSEHKMIEEQNSVIRNLKALLNNIIKINVR